MKRILRGAVLLAVTAVLGACGTEPDQVKGGVADHIVADPGVVFISRADSQSVKIRLEDAQGTALHDPISISNVGAGINVRADSAFRPIFTNGDSLVFNTNGTELRVWVSTSALANSSFTINAGGLTLDVPVVVTPGKDEGFAFSTLAPALADVVTVTAPADLLFTADTKVIFGLDSLTPIAVATDGKSLTFSVVPDLHGPATLSNVTLSYNTAVKFPVVASDTMNSPSGFQAFTFSNLAPAPGEPITITPPAGLIFSDSSKATFDSLGLVPVLTVAPGGASMTLTASPNSVGPTTFTNMVSPTNALSPFSLKSTDTLKSATNVQAFTFSDLTPALGQLVTVTPPAGLIFTDSTKVTFDSTGPTPKFTFAPGFTSLSLNVGPNSVGPTTFTNMVRATNPTAPFSLTSTDTLVSPVLSTLSVTVDDATPAVDQAITVTSAMATLKFSPTATYTIGGRTAFVVSRAADSNSVVLLAEPGANGVIAMTKGLVSGFSLDLPTTTNVTAADQTPLAGTGSFASAPTFNAPAVGVTQSFWDGDGTYPFNAADAGGTARLYKLVVPANQTIKFALPNITDGADLGVYFYDAAGTFLPSLGVDSKGGGASNAESGNVSLTAGTYFVAIVYFNYAASPTPAKHYKFSMTGL